MSRRLRADSEAMRRALGAPAPAVCRLSAGRTSDLHPPGREGWRVPQLLSLRYLRGASGALTDEMPLEPPVGQAYVSIKQAPNGTLTQLQVPSRSSSTAGRAHCGTSMARKPGTSEAQRPQLAAVSAGPLAC